VNLQDAFAYVPKTKNDQPRAVHLPPVVVAALASHPRGLDRRHKDGRGQKVFRFVKCGRIYTWLGKAKAAAGADLSFVTFHVFRHTWATWMRRYSGLDTRGLVGTGAWDDAASAQRYAHVVASEESRRADMLPVEESWKVRARIGISTKIRAR
jgi:integrase